MTIFRRLVVHHCDANPDPARFVVRYNDFGVQIADIPNITRGCPFCWCDYHTLRRNRFNRYTARAFVARPEELKAPIADAVRRLERPGFPKNGICSHFGVFVSVRGLGMHVMPDGPHLKVSMSQSLFRRPASLHQARASAIADALITGIVKTWNGADGHDSCTVILTRNAPESLLCATGNYHAMGFRCFNPTPADKAGYAAFDAWYNAPITD